MPGLSEIISSIQGIPQQDRPSYLMSECGKYIKEISNITGRNTIAYYSGWMKYNVQEVSIVESDVNAFMNAVYQMDRGKGLDIVLHTPGGNIAAAECIVNYLKSLFGNDIRAIIPQISMSAGTMIAMSCSSIIMGRQSSLGPIDPQINGVACQMVVDEFARAVSEVERRPASLGLWQTIISKYGPTYLTVCEDAIKWSKELATKWLMEVNPEIDMNKVEETFINHEKSYSHNRHISKEDCKNAGLNIVDLEDNQQLQENVLSLHHCFMTLIDLAPLSKVVINQDGRNYIQSVNIDKK